MITLSDMAPSLSPLTWQLEAARAVWGNLLLRPLFIQRRAAELRVSTNARRANPNANHDPIKTIFAQIPNVDGIILTLRKIIIDKVATLCETRLALKNEHSAAGALPRPTER